MLLQLRGGVHMLRPSAIALMQRSIFSPPTGAGRLHFSVIRRSPPRVLPRVTATIGCCHSCRYRPLVQAAPKDRCSARVHRGGTLLCFGIPALVVVDQSEALGKRDHFGE
jgi:hypothetical protein